MTEHYSSFLTAGSKIDGYLESPMFRRGFEGLICSHCLVTRVICASTLAIISIQSLCSQTYDESPASQCLIHRSSRGSASRGLKSHYTLTYEYLEDPLSKRERSMMSIQCHEQMFRSQSFSMCKSTFTPCTPIFAICPPTATSS